VRRLIPRGWRAWAVLLLRLLAVGLVLLVVGRLLGLERGTWPSAAMIALPIWLAAAYPLLLASVLLRQRVLSWVALLLTGAHVLVIAPSTGRDAGPCVGTPLRVVASNVLKFNGQSVEAGRALVALGPDVLVLPEVTAFVASGLQVGGVEAALPYALGDPAPEFETTVIRSRVPFRDPELRPIAGQVEPRATIDVGGVPVRLLGVHPQPPITGQGKGWQRALQDLDGELRAQQGAAVAAGDFNGGRDLRSFRRLLDDGVRDSHELVGRGLASTWPAGHPFLHLDHVLVKGGVSVCDVRQVRIPGSDHLAVVADLAVS
jgi:endonuclease/exonuclease/phosphatase (EEP) superfamily protein YafD